MRPIASFIVAAAAASLAMLAGCDREPEQPPTGGAPAYGERAIPPNAGRSVAQPEGGSPEGSGSAKQALDDAGITAQVKAKLLASPDVDGTSINVDTSQGRVTLVGEVSDKSQIDRAVRIARSVDGVKAVESELTARGSG